MMRDLSLIFDSTAILYTLKPIPAAGSMPPGWHIRMPLGDQHVNVELFTLEPGRHGAYRLTASKRVPVDNWESTALCMLGALVAAIVTEGKPMTDTVAESLACKFHQACSTGTTDVDVSDIYSTLGKVIDLSAMQWVTVRQAQTDGPR